MNRGDIKIVIDQLDYVDSCDIPDSKTIANTISMLETLSDALAEKDAEIERLCDSVNYKHSKICELDNQLAASELVIQQLRELLSTTFNSMFGSHTVMWQKKCAEIITTPVSTEHLEAWYKEQVGEPIAWNYELTEEAFIRASVAGINMDTPLHAIKPFPFKGSDAQTI